MNMTGVGGMVSMGDIAPVSMIGCASGDELVQLGVQCWSLREKKAWGGEAKETVVWQLV